MNYGVMLVKPIPSVLLATLMLVVAACSSASTVSSDIVARVNGSDVTLAELDRAYASRIQGADPAPAEEEVENLRLQILNELIINEVLLQLADEAELTATDAEVDVRFNDFKSQYSEERLQEVLAEQQLTAEEVREELRMQLTIDKLLNMEITSKISVSDAGIEEFFDKNREGFNLPETFHFAHLLVTPFEDAGLNNLEGDDATTEQEADEKAQRLLREILGGQDFATHARRYSEDPSSTGVGGDLNFQSIDSIAGVDPALADAILQMRVGETYPRVIQTRFGNHLLKLLEIDAGGQKDLTDPRIETEIHQLLLNQQDQTLRAAFFETIRNTSTIENFMAQRILDRAGSS